MNQQAVRLPETTEIPQPPVSTLFGIPVARVDMEQALDLVSAAISSGQRPIFAWHPSYDASRRRPARNRTAWRRGP